MSSINETDDFEDLYDNAPCGYVSFSSDGLMLKANQTWLAWLGYQSEEIISKKRFQDFLSVGEQIFFETQVSPLLQVQGLAAEINFSLLTKERKKIPVLTSTKQYLASDRESKINRMIIFNITDRKKYESELIRERQAAELAAKTKGDFLAMLSHEIRTPLNAVIGVSNLLESTTLSAEQEPFMDMLRNSSDNLLNLLNSILDLSKIESGRLAVETKQFQFRKFVEGNNLAWHGLAHKKGIKVNAEIDPNLPTSVTGDPVKITQILSNLMGNAVKFTASGAVTLRAQLVSTDAAGIKVKFEIQDTGIGIAPEKLTQIFEEFSQADYETSTKFGGTGLGLTISQELAKLMGSQIKVDSKLGQGSCFSFEILLQQGDPNSDTHGIERVANQANALFGLRVLVADDSVDNIVLMQHLFKKWGAEVKTATNGKEALAHVTGESFDVVLMDMRMPVMNGHETALAIRALCDPVKSKDPIIAFSGSTSFEGQEITDEKLFDAVVGKPFKPAELIATLLMYSKV